MELYEDMALSDGELTLRLEKTVEADPARQWVPGFRFAICDGQGAKIGTCDLRLGHNERTYYGGNIGYAVDAPHRGHRYAAKACILLFKLAKARGMDHLLITCGPENGASRRTCEILGGRLLEIAELPEDNDMRLENGETRKCIFRFDL